ncbi:MAG: hypothetical protein JXB30_16560 [Anaerolineae bacterium]|nr:hypothetical protein [Anaerolineae bacterium]
MPTSDLEALVGHLFIVGGRSISAASPGAIATAPPRRAARGRDYDTLFALITLSAEQRQPASFYEQLTEQLSKKYFSTAGSITAALREAVAVINDTLLAHNNQQPEPLQVGMICAILREQELILALTGSSRCFLIRGDRVERLPADEELGETIRQMGVDSEPELRLYRREVNDEDFLILADGSLNRLKDATFRQAVETGDVENSLNNLRGVAGEFTSAQVIKFVTPLPEGEIADTYPSQAPAVAQPPDLARESPEQIQADIPPGVKIPMPMKGIGARSEDQELPPLRKFGRDTAIGLASVVDGAQVLVEKMMPEEEVENPLEERFKLSTSMQIGVVLAVAVLVALVTAVIYKWRGQNLQYYQLIQQAQSEIDQARDSGDDQAAARPHWENAIYLFDQAAQIRPPISGVAPLRSEALAALDSYDHVTRVSPVLLREYQLGAVLRGPIVQGLNLYLIDTTSDILYREDLDESSTTLVNREPQIITQRGERLGNQVVGGLIDLAWMEDGGVAQRNVLAVLSSQGLLITYSPSWSVSAAALPGFEAWQDPRAIAVYNRDLYILDAGANEIWRYTAEEDSYTNLPQRYFTDVEPQLGDAVDMEIDTNGNVYILHTTGQLSKYFFGRETAFTFDGLPQPITRASALSLNLSLFDQTFLIADIGGGRLYSTALTGMFLTNYKDSGNTIFYNLSGAFSQDRPPMIYVTASNRLFYFSRP